MKKKWIICFFILIFWGLMICTVLSIHIHQQMTANVTVIKQEGFSLSGIRLPVSVLFFDKNGIHLYEVGEGDSWEKGKQVKEVEPYQYQIEEENVLVFTGSEYGYIQYASKAIKDGDLIQVVSQNKRKEALYFMIAEEEEKLEESKETIHIIEKKDSTFLFSMVGKQPYMEEEVRDALSISDTSKLYHLDEIIAFFENLPWISAAFVLLLIFLMLWGYVCILLRDWYKNRYFLAGSLGTALLLFVIFIWIINRISLPSSLLPDTNIFEFSYYRNEFSEVFLWLKEFSGIGLEIKEKLEKWILLAKGIFLFGFFGGVAIFGKLYCWIRR